MSSRGQFIYIYIIYRWFLQACISALKGEGCRARVASKSCLSKFQYINGIFALASKIIIYRVVFVFKVSSSADHRFFGSPCVPLNQSLSFSNKNSNFTLGILKISLCLHFLRHSHLQFFPLSMKNMHNLRSPSQLTLRHFRGSNSLILLNLDTLSKHLARNDRVLRSTTFRSLLAPKNLFCTVLRWPAC